MHYAALTVLTVAQVFYDQFGRLMMDQPVIGFAFTTYAPIALVPYVLLLILNVFNRLAAVFVRSKRWECAEDWQEDAASEAGARRLVRELENRDLGRPLGLSLENGACVSAWYLDQKSGQ